MLSETALRIGLFVMFALTVAVTAYFRLRAAASGERISHKEEGFVFAIVLRLMGLILWLLTITYLVWPSALGWASLPILNWLRWVAVAVGSLSSLLMWWTLSSLGMNLTDTVVTRSAATLVMHGPYRWVRHPFYVTTALLMASATLVSANWAIGFVSLVVLMLLAIRTPNEEQRLIERFGQQYRDYIATTGRFVPRFHRR